jgi:hypothetical protein
MGQFEINYIKEFKNKMLSIFFERRHYLVD